MKKFLLVAFAFVSLQFSHAQLAIYSNNNLQGTSGSCAARVTYTGSSIPNGLNNSIKSISLSLGYMATLAENEDGSGERFTYMATKSRINVNLALVLQNKVSFIRVLKLPSFTIKKKGSANTNNNYTNDLNVSWFYDWGLNDFSTPTREFAPMAWGASGASDANINNVIAKDSLTHLLAFNEPDNSGQSNLTVATAIPLYKKLLRAGHRMGSPACTESQYRVWLDSFTNMANDQKLKIDVVCVHWYDWGNWLSTLNANPTPTEVFNRFKNYINNVYDLYKKPIWVTEFNANPNRPSAVQEGFINLVVPWLDSDPRIERYSYFFGNDVPMYNTNGTLTQSAIAYAGFPSVDAYPENVIDTRPAVPITLAAWDPSTFTQGGNTVANFAPTTINTNLTAPLALTRGSGVVLPDATASNGYWGGMQWSTTTADAGVTANKFMRFSLKSKTGKSVNYHSIDKFNIRINGIGPIQYQIDYQLDNGAFSPIATVSGPTRTTGNYQLGPIDLSGIAGLQDVPSTSTITFRITPFDASGTGSFLIGSGTGDTDPDLTITGGYSDDNIISSPLPSTLFDFQLKRTGNKVALNWTTQQEINASHFELERSDDKTTFQKVATISSANIVSGSKYSFTDVALAPITYYYRLKMVDKDGSAKNSHILSAPYNSGSINISLYPTLTTGTPVKAVYTNVSKAAQLKVVNLIGQTISSYNLQEGSGIKTIETNQLQAGTYLLQLIDNGTVQSLKFIKQ